MDTLPVPFILTSINR